MIKTQSPREPRILWFIIDGLVVVVVVVVEDARYLSLSSSFLVDSSSPLQVVKHLGSYRHCYGVFTASLFWLLLLLLAIGAWTAGARSRMGRLLLLIALLFLVGHRGPTNAKNETAIFVPSMVSARVSRVPRQDQILWPGGEISPFSAHKVTIQFILCNAVSYAGWAHRQPRGGTL